MKNKKGFMFIETIVTLTILMTLLVVLYGTFINLLQKEKIGAEYDKYGDSMNLFYYKESIDNDVTVVAKHIAWPNFNSDEVYCNYVAIKCPNKDIPQLDNCELSRDFETFIKGNLDCPKENQFVLLGEFKTDNTYSYAHIYYPNYEDEE